MCYHKHLFMEKQSKILVTGASGLIGSALVRLLEAEGYENVLTPDSSFCDLRFQKATYNYFEEHKPEYVFHLAACVGGIKSNFDYPGEFIFDNTIMHCNVFESCRVFDVKKLLFPGSACAYPRDAEQPIKESSLLRGMPEPTNLAYAVAKQNGIVMAQSYAKQFGMKVVLPMVANTYGIGDKSTHVIPQMIEKFDSDTDVVLWGTGTPLREFIYADDVAEAFLFLMLNYDSPEIINVGTGVEYSISALAHKISDAIRYERKIGFDETKPDGIPRKCLDSSRIRAMGWKPKVSLEEGLGRIIDADK